MKKKFALRAIALTVGSVLCMGSVSLLAGCGGIPSDKAALVIMTEDLNELYNPFYSTAGTDMDVVGQTQISMLSTDENGDLAYGNDEPTVVLDYKSEYDPATDTTSYYYVLKNGLKFSDGVPLTMNDVMFNLYVYLDPAYTGSTTMYSTDIVGLQAYRTQKNTSDDNADEETNNSANNYARNRIQALVDFYREVAQMDDPSPSAAHSASETDMKNAIAAMKEAYHNGGNPDYPLPDSYLEAIGLEDYEAACDQLWEDYQNALDKFKEELKSDYKSARSSYTEEPYKSAPIYYSGQQIGTGFDEIISFMYAEHLVQVEYPTEAGKGKNMEKIEKATLSYNPNTITNEEQAIDFVYRSNTQGALDQVLQYWATGTQLLTEFTGKAKDILLHRDVDGTELKHKNVSGIVSLGHTTQETKVDIGDKSYPVAHDHNPDGTPQNAGEYDVLRITINKIDPKAKWNFGFTVAPYHYYSDKGAQTALAKKNLAIPDTASNEELLKRSCWQNVGEVDIASNKFGVAWADSDFQTTILQGDNSWGVKKTKVPLGAGPYIATDKNDRDQPTAEGFFENNIVYYKANHNFSLDGVTPCVPKIEHMRYMELSVSNALSTLESGQVHFVSPQFTKKNAEKIDKLKGKGVGSVDSWQLGYGYIGINAAKVPKLELRKAIMAAMDTSLALEYYLAGTAENIYWPMSCVSWAYPRKTGTTYDGTNPTANKDDDNKHEYTKYTDKENAVKLIKQYMAQANVAAGNSALEIEFTIAGANMYDHPAYLVFKNAMDILNDECGWKVSIKPDANGLTKLSTGSLAVWAAAWGSTIDPDMYQVYHKNSTATSVLAWGYPSIKDTAQSEYKEERDILNKLSVLIDEARETDVIADRAAKYKDAMSYVLDLAVELPLYQRKTLYAYNLNVIEESSMPHNEQGQLAVNPYTSPLAKIWELEFTK